MKKPRIAISTRRNKRYKKREWLAALWRDEFSLTTQSFLVQRESCETITNKSSKEWRDKPKERGRLRDQPKLMLRLNCFLLHHATCCIKKIICVSCCEASASSSSLFERSTFGVDQNSSGSLRLPSVGKKNATKPPQIPRKPHKPLDYTVSI